MVAEIKNCSGSKYYVFNPPELKNSSSGIVIQFPKNVSVFICGSQILTGNTGSLLIGAHVGHEGVKIQNNKNYKTGQTHFGDPGSLVLSLSKLVQSLSKLNQSLITRTQWMGTHTQWLSMHAQPLSKRAQSLSKPSQLFITPHQWMGMHTQWLSMHAQPLRAYSVIQ